jgi:hypothetical protein
MVYHRKRHPFTFEEAEILGLKALAFLAEDDVKLGHFMALTGISADVLRTSAGSVDVLQAVLEHLSRDESLLLVFAETTSLAPEDVAVALYVLGGSSYSGYEQ